MIPCSPPVTTPSARLRWIHARTRGHDHRIASIGTTRNPPWMTNAAVTASSPKNSPDPHESWATRAAARFTAMENSSRKTYSGIQ